MWFYTDEMEFVVIERKYIRSMINIDDKILCRIYPGNINEIRWNKTKQNNPLIKL